MKPSQTKQPPAGSKKEWSWSWSIGLKYGGVPVGLIFVFGLITGLLAKEILWGGLL